MTRPTTSPPPKPLPLLGGWPPVPGYELLGVLGEGDMGTVYRAHHPALRRELAVKVLRSHFRGQALARRRFLGEAQVTGQLQHPGVPPVHEQGELPDGSPVLAMKLVTGRTLADLQKERAGPDADRPRFLAIFEQVCQALAVAGGLIKARKLSSGECLKKFG